MPALRIFCASFLVLFLEIALIRWLPANIRLLSFFSNFILLASFLGIGLGCLLAQARVRLFNWFPLVLLAIVAGAIYFRIEVNVVATGAIYFSSGTNDNVLQIESVLLLPAIFSVVVVVFTALAQRMGREMTALPALPAYTWNVVGSLAGVVVLGVISWSELPPSVWFGIAALTAAPLLFSAEPGLAPPNKLQAGLAAAALVVTVIIVTISSANTLWSPYYKIVVHQQGSDIVVEVNNIFHQSMAPLEQKEYFYQWPYAVFGDTFDSVLVLGAGSGSDVAAALRHGARHVDAVEIDPTIIRLGRELHPDQPFSDPRVTVINDDARHYLRTTTKKYDMVVFALIDSLTLQSGFSGVRLESYMFTQEAFNAVRDRLTDNGVLAVYNYFREAWLVDRLANSAAVAFGTEPHVHVHEARSFLGVMLAGPRVATMPASPPIPDRVTAFGQSHAPSPARLHVRDRNIEPASDDWPFLYLRDRHIPRHYILTLLLILGASVAVVTPVVRRAEGRWSWQFFLLGAGFMLLETKSITQFALLWGSTWVVASLAIASVLVMALAANFVVSKWEIHRPWLVGGILLVLLGLNYFIPVGRLPFDSLVAESMTYALLGFSPIFCAGLLFGSAIKRSTSLPRDYGTNLLGAMAGGVAEYLALITGYGALIALIALCYAGAVATRPGVGK
ncbi:MAG: spermidine synthase [Vicinamibacterales bacterium]